MPRNYNMSLSVQQDLGHGTLLSVAYAAAVLGRYLQLGYGLDAGSLWFAVQNIDPTTGTPLSDNFYQPYTRLNNINYIAHAFTSNYNGLFVTLNRRFGGLDLRMYYSYSKFLDVTNGNTSIPRYQNWHNWNYDFDPSDQTHNLVISYVCSPARCQQGAGASCAGPLRARQMDRIGDRAIHHGAAGRDELQHHRRSQSERRRRRSADERMRRCLFGEHSHVLPVVQHRCLLPSWFQRSGQFGQVHCPQPRREDDVDTALTNFPIKSERRYFSLRWEAYNTFNHTQFSSVNTAARFQPNGQQVNALFGTVTATRAPRVMQGSLRFTF